jgi:hypothetical protein
MEGRCVRMVTATLCHKAESKRFQPYFFAQIHPYLPKKAMFSLVI